LVDGHELVARFEDDARPNRTVVGSKR
jgi:hypothetical protein